jgi:hypothetical protein
MLNVCTKNIAKFFENTEVLFLPRNTTWLLQALDHAIIVALRVTCVAHFPDCVRLLDVRKNRAPDASVNHSVSRTQFMLLHKQLTP